MLSHDDLRRLLQRPDLTDEQAEETFAMLQWLAEAMIDTYLIERSQTRAMIGGIVDDQRLAAGQVLVLAVRIPEVRCRLQSVPKTQHLFADAQGGMPQQGIEPSGRKKTGKRASRKGMSRKIVAPWQGSSSGMGVFCARRSGELAFSMKLWSCISLAAPRCRKSNFALPDELIRWFKVLRTLPGMEAVTGGK